MYSNDYQSIRGMFVIKNQDNYKFCPKDKDNFKKSIRFALESSFKDFNFRTLTATKEFKSNYKKWEEERKDQRKSQKKEKKILNQL